MQPVSVSSADTGLSSFRLSISNLPVPVLLIYLFFKLAAQGVLS